MKNIRKIITFLSFYAAVIILTAGFIFGQAKVLSRGNSNLVSPNVVISEVYGGGGINNSYQADFVELYNDSAVAVSLNGWSVQYFTQAATSSSNIVNLPNVNIQPGQFYLIQMNTAATGGTAQALPTPDYVSPANINLNQSQGKVLLSSVITPYSTPCPASQTSNVVDKVGYGTTATVCNETTNAGAPSGTTSVTRLTETDNNSVDFSVIAPTPQNSLTVTAAPATVSGRVVNNTGNGLSKIQVKIVGGELSQPLFVVTNPFGYFNFEVPSGQTYIVTVNSKSYTFSNPSQVISVNENVSDLNFAADER